jgi:anaphase-promoting complex subunit 11
MLARAWVPKGTMGKLAVVIRKVHGVAIWRWDVNDDCCGICRMPFDACCPDCKTPGDDCPPGSKIYRGRNCAVVSGGMSPNSLIASLLRSKLCVVSWMMSLFSVWGECTHAFHMHCIVKWVEAQQDRQHCPMCRREWKFQ